MRSDGVEVAGID